MGKITSESIKVICATSIGSVIGLLLICGYTAQDIFSQMYVLQDIIKFSINSIGKQGRLASIDPLIDIIKSMVLAKLARIPTLSQLLTITGKTLVVSVSNFTRGRGEYFTPYTQPNLDVLQAIKISSSLPYIFEKVELNGQYYIDGGLADNFPLDHPALRVCRKILSSVVIPVTESNIDSTSIFSLNYLYNIFNILNVSLLMKTIKYATTDQRITIVRMCFKEIGTIQFNLTSEEKMKMYLRGYEEAKIEDNKEYMNVSAWTIEDPLMEWNDQW